uniref:Retrotransposon gag domain-containing protein n=1 Tax=Vitis vinifera TaxID=29760 RepID=F6I3N0_VITVI
MHENPSAPTTLQRDLMKLGVDLPSWVRVEGSLVHFFKISDIDQRVVTVDQFTTAMASIQKALVSLRHKIGSQQSRQPIVQDETPYDSLPPPPLPPIPTMSQAPPYISHGHSEVAPFAVVQTTILEDTHACMDHIEQRIRQLRVSNSSSSWDDLDSILVASLPAKFRMPDIEKYTGVSCPRIHLRLYSTVMRAHGLDESQMITMFPLSLSGIAQHWFASLESSRRRTWDDLTQEFL